MDLPRSAIRVRPGSLTPPICTHALCWRLLEFFYTQFSILYPSSRRDEELIEAAGGQQRPRGRTFVSAEEISRLKNVGHFSNVLDYARLVVLYYSTVLIT